MTWICSKCNNIQDAETSRHWVFSHYGLSSSKLLELICLVYQQSNLIRSDVFEAVTCYKWATKFLAVSSE